MEIPLVDLHKLHSPILEKIEKAMNSVISRSSYISGVEIEEFEKDFAAFMKVDHVVGVSSGTDALFLALRSIDIEEGDCVVTVPNTFIATTEAITMAGGVIAFVDVDEKTANMCPEALENFLKNRTGKEIERVKAVIFVNLYGNPAGLEMVYEITRKYNLSLISDASQAHGALIDNRSITDFADITTYSYYPAKNLGAFCDAGAVATNDGRVAEKIRLLRNHGRKEKYLHEIEAYNCRMDTIQAAVLNVKLRYLEKWNNSRINMAKLYNTLLSEKGYFIPEIDERYRSVYHLYVTRLEDREIVMKKLKEAGVSTGIHYPFPLHLQPAYEYLGSKKGDFPVSEELSEKVLSLPIDGCITPEEIEYIVGVLPVLF